MRLALCVLLVCVTAQRSAGQVTGSQPSEATTQASESLSPDRLFALASPAVVKIIVKDEDDREIGQGSGFIVEYEGGVTERFVETSLYRWASATIATNYHVIRPAVYAEVLFGNGETHSVFDVVAEDESVDVALLRVIWSTKATSLTEATRTLKLHEGSNPPVGTRVYTIGSPRGLGNTLSEGLISGYRELAQHTPWIQITAPISPGSSGGPVLSPDGRVLGMTTATIKSGQNLNFAIPAKEILRVLNAPKDPRKVWEGASIRRTEREAFAAARLTFFYGRCEYRSEAAHDPSEPDGLGDIFRRWKEEPLERQCLDSKVREGDQLALLVKGRELYSEKAYEEALVMLRRATEAKAGDFAHLAHFALAKAIENKIRGWGNRSGNVKVKEFERILQPLKVAKDLNPDFAPTVYLLAYTYDLLDSVGDKTPELLLEANDLVRLMPRCYEAYQFRGTAWAALGRAEAFERDFATAVQLRPNDQLLLLEKAEGYAELNNDRRAAETYKEAIEVDADSKHCPLLYYSLAMTYQRLGDCSADAIAAYEKGNLFGAGNFIGKGSFKYQIAQCRNQLNGRP